MAEKNKQRVAKNIFGLAGVFWVASELSRRSWIALPTFGNLKSVDIFATHPDNSKVVEIQVKTIQKEKGRRFWFVGKSREHIPNRKSLSFVFVFPESDNRFEAFVVPSRNVHREAVPSGKIQFCWKYPKESGERYKGNWDILG